MEKEIKPNLTKIDLNEQCYLFLTGFYSEEYKCILFMDSYLTSTDLMQDMYKKRITEKDLFLMFDSTSLLKYKVYASRFIAYKGKYSVRVHNLAYALEKLLLNRINLKYNFTDYPENCIGFNYSSVFVYMGDMYVCR